jgi:hypothetical protein
VTAWSELVALAERELELIDAQRWDEAAALGAERARRAQRLAPAPPAARPQLERLLELQTQIGARLVAARGLLVRELAGMRKGAKALRGYSATTATAAAQHRVDGVG